MIKTLTLPQNGKKKTFLWNGINKYYNKKNPIKLLIKHFTQDVCS